VTPRRASSLLAGATITVLVATAIALAAPSPIGAQEDGAALAPLADCVARRGHLLAMLLIDESGSLRRTDPSARRVDATRAALSGLDELRRSTGSESVEVEVLVAGFSVGFDVVADWTALDDASFEDLYGEVAAFSGRNAGIDTDYAAALLGAQSAFASRTGQLEREACKLLLWFTDGELDIEPRSTGESKAYAPDIAITDAASAERVEGAARDAICKREGIADALRRDRVVVAAFALSPEIADADRAFLESIAEGRSGPARCGTVPIPNGHARGAYVPSDAMDEVISSFFASVARLNDGTLISDETVPVCPGDGCPEGTHRFTVDPGVGSFNLLALTGSPDISVEIRSPDAEAPLALEPGPASVGSLAQTSVVSRWLAADALLATATLPGPNGPWVGEWEVTFIDRTGQHPDAVARAEIYVYGDVVPALDPVPELRAGEASTIAIRLEGGNGDPLDLELFDSVRVEATVTDPALGVSEPVELRAEDAQHFTGSWTPPSPEFPALVNISVTAQPITRSGYALNEVTRTAPVSVLPPAIYPTVSPSELRLTTVTGVGTAQGDLTITAPGEAGGCAWIRDVAVESSPADAGTIVLGAVSAMAPRDCLKIEAGGSRTLTLEATNSGAADGTARGVVTVALRSDNTDDVVFVATPITFDLVRPIDEVTRVVVAAALIAAGLLVPLLVMWLLNWVTGRFHQPSALQVGSVDVKVVDDEIRRLDGTTPLLVRDDFGNVPVGEARPRRFEVRGLSFRARAVRLNPFVPPAGEVSLPGAVVASNDDHGGDPARGVAEVPLALAGTWLLVASIGTTPDGTVPATLICFADTGRLRLQMERLEHSIEDRAAVVARRLRQALVHATPPAPAPEAPPPTATAAAQMPPSTDPRAPGGESGAPPRSTTPPPSSI
jgi:hypothetical protein